MGTMLYGKGVFINRCFESLNQTQPDLVVDVHCDYLKAGADVIVQPRTLGPFEFGVSTRITSGKTATPAAFSITWLEARTDEERQKIRDASRKVAQELLGIPGFIGWVGSTVGYRMMTVTAWESSDAMRALVSRRGFGNRSVPLIVNGVWPCPPATRAPRRSQRPVPRRRRATRR